jgi:hypothetical protein
MAITIERTTSITGQNQISKGAVDNVIVALSDQVSQPGFRYVFTFNITNYYLANVASTMYIHPNPQNRGIFNMRPHVINSITNRIYKPELYDKFVHRWKAVSGNPSLIADKDLINSRMVIEVVEGWEVSGVFTVNPNSSEPVLIELMGFHGWTNSSYFDVLNCAAEFSGGYIDFDRYTYYSRINDKIPPSFRGKYTYVPTIMSQYGTICVNADDGYYCTDQDSLTKYVLIEYYQANGTFIANETSYTMKPEAGAVGFIPAYAGNVNQIDPIYGIPLGTQFYTLQLRDENDEACSDAFLFYIEDADCKFTPINLGWIGKKGGWNYYLFTKMNQDSIDIERTEYKRPFGNYAQVGADIENPGQLTTDWSEMRQYVSRENMATKYLTINSDWISEKEFEYLESLMVADVVHWVSEDYSEPIPMIITDNSYILRRERNSTKYNLTLKLKYANDYIAIHNNTYSA